MNILITGGAGFIGSALVRHIINTTSDTVINIDKLTYASNGSSLASVNHSGRYHFEQMDICDRHALDRIFAQYRPDAVMHLAAESHVDRSIENACEFINSNIVGTFHLLEASRKHYAALPAEKAALFRFHHVSTDEVYGDLAGTNNLFTEKTAYAPSSPYAAAKASSDHLVRAWHKTYELPIVISHCSNNYGPYQFPEKLIPLMILNALEGKPLPVYGQGEQIRDWLYVEDHVQALYQVLKHGITGESYNIGGHNEQRNIDVVKTLCDLLDNMQPPALQPATSHLHSYRELISFVSDRPGHDKRYAIDAGKIQHGLGWAPRETFATGLAKTVAWYLNNESWWRAIRQQTGQNRHPEKTP